MSRHARPTASTCYPFDTGDAAEYRRLQGHAALWDDFTFRVLDRTGVARGWRCLEIGAGTGTVAAWLVARVGPRGQVVATDIETRWLEPLAAANLEVRHHNVAVDPIEHKGFDLIHARLVLEHLPDRAAVTGKLVEALRPGGWLVVEDYDIRTMAFVQPAHDAWVVVNRAVIDVMRSLGSDPVCGEVLVHLLRGAHLADVATEGFVRALPIPALTSVFRPALERLRDPLLRSASVSAAQFDAALAQFDAREDARTTYTPILVAASGRRP